jgi:hypothetical protein
VLKSGTIVLATLLIRRENEDFSCEIRQVVARLDFEKLHTLQKPHPSKFLGEACDFC